MEKIIICFLLMCLILSCKTNSDSNNTVNNDFIDRPVETSITGSPGEKQSKLVKYKVLVISSKNNLSMDRSKLSSLADELYLCYYQGINFKYSGNNFNTISSAEISPIKIDTRISKEVRNRTEFIIEQGEFEIEYHEITGYNEKYTVNSHAKGKSYKSVLSKVYFTAVRKTGKKNIEGKIIPYDNLNVNIDRKGNIIISGKFVIYVQ